MTDYPNLNGCNFCGIPKLDHAMRYHWDKGWHAWHTPTDSQRKRRWKEFVNAKEVARRQQAIEDTLAGLQEMFSTNLHMWLDPEQEEEMKKLLIAGYRHYGLGQK